MFADRLGHLQGEVHLVVEDSVQPSKCPARRLPVVLKEEVKEELDCLEQMGALAEVQDPTDCVSGMVVERKSNGKLRICIDPRPLN